MVFVDSFEQVYLYFEARGESDLREPYKAQVVSLRKQLRQKNYIPPRECVIFAKSEGYYSGYGFLNVWMIC